MIAVAALDLFLYSYPKPEAAVASVRTTVAAPRRGAVKTYFHSPLNAPAMSTSSFTSMGYFSTDPSSEFRGDYNAAGAVTPVVSTGSISGGLNWGDPTEASDIAAIQKVYTLPKAGQPHPSISQ